ncbi:MAG TPA: FkbM family methyltransferase [Gaiellaceae bacterium]|nr:FkbM family methyltransferase [Gaiellaceae bacterium]
MLLGRRVWCVRARLLGPDRIVVQPHVEALAGAGVLGRRGRARLRALLVRELLFGPPDHAQVAIGRARVELGDQGALAVDWKALVEVVAGAGYVEDYRGAHVLDVGAHKGYFGALALARGAAFVASFEPATSNFEALARAAAPLAGRWLARNAAVWSRAGQAVLRLDGTSWAHSLVAVERPAGQERVAVVTLEQALAELPVGGSRTIVKIDAEGSECAILSGAPLDRVDVLLVEWHAAVAPCTRDELVAAVDEAGLALTDERDGVLRFARG